MPCKINGGDNAAPLARVMHQSGMVSITSSTPEDTPEVRQ
jgi:hypothetical protein